MANDGGGDDDGQRDKVAALEAARGEAAELVNEVELWHGWQSDASVALLLGLGGIVDVNRRPSVDGATVLHCAAYGGAPNAAAVVTTLLAASVDLNVPDMSSLVFASDEFWMFKFKIQPCARAYSHDWIECLFLHPGENARRQDPRRYVYTAVPCPSSQLPGGLPAWR